MKNTSSGFCFFFSKFFNQENQEGGEFTKTSWIYTREKKTSKKQLFENMTKFVETKKSMKSSKMK
jgi:hypothetical protein